MKIGFIVSTMVAICLAIVVVMGMGQFSDLKKEVAGLKKEQPAKSAGSSTRTGTGSRTGRLQSPSSRASGPSKSERAVVENDDPEEERRTEWEENPQKMIGEFIKAWSESDFGKRMEQAENKRKASRLYGPLVEELGLSDEDQEYFLGLAGSAAGSEDKLWGELMFAEQEDREAVLQKWEDANDEREASMREFLNDESDWQRYQDYEARIEEHEQVQGDIRRAMEGAGVPLTPEQESQLVEVMHGARQQGGINEKWTGRGVLNQLSEPGIADRLEADWQAGQEAMSAGVANVLSPQQVEAFNESQSRQLRGATEGLRAMESFIGGGQQTE
ncbi:MAG: hypothetical protein MK194_06400 [Roseibacillus sp.]|nr:hypothetical protein [Roseibacillus sp.]